MRPVLTSTLHRPAIDRLRAVAHPLEALDPTDYAYGHAAFEARSDQRALLTHWLVDRLAGREAPAVLSVGCGDGTVDAQLARALGAGSFTGVEPHAPSAAAFLDRLTGTGVQARALTATWDSARLDEQYDVITFVHSLYYVADVGVALERAAGLLRPGGEVLVLHAPRQGLNELAGLLAPVASEWWAEDTGAALASSTLVSRSERVDGRLDLTDCLDETDPLGCAVLDFLVQGRLTDTLRPLVLDVLSELALPGPGLVVAHPLRGWVLSRG